MQNSSRVTSMDRLRARLREFRDANGANVTVTFALATIPMVGFVGAAVDYSHANSLKAAMQAAADSTALMLSKEAYKLTNSEMQTKANGYFKALFNRPEAKDLTVKATYTTGGGYKLKIDAAATVKTDFMKLMGFSSLKVGADSQVAWGNTKLRVALALDNTGSMKDSGKMDALKVATKGLLTQLKNAAPQNGDVYVSIVPFSKSVNVGKHNWNQNWIKWDDWDDENGDDVSTTKCNNSKGKKKKCTTSTTWVPDNHNTWNGCVMDRDKDYDTKNTAPNPGVKATLFPAEQYDGCPTELQPLSYNWTQLEKTVNDMTPTGMTNQTIGVQWAFQSLTAAPFTIPPKDPNFKYSDVIILMTDGLNTENRFDDSTATIDSRTLAACANAKAAGITIYAIQVNTGGDPTQTFLKSCASTPDKFVELKSANQMVSTFQQIGTALSNLRIAQ